MTGPRRTYAAQMAELARVLQDEPDVQATMEAAAKLAVSNISGCDAAAVSLVERRGRRIDTPASTDDLAFGGDLLQYQLGEGPCLDAVWEERVVHSADLAAETRWPAWAPRVAREYGARSMLCLQLFTRADTLGALNLYSLSPGAFDSQARDDGLALAAHIAIALAASQEAQQLNDALDSRTVIGQACGILMERYDLGPAAAFNVLARISADSNQKLRDLARDLVETRHLPDGQ